MDTDSSDSNTDGMTMVLNHFKFAYFLLYRLRR